VNPSDILVGAETLIPGPVPLWQHVGWRERFPWLVQGTTGAGEVADPFDLGLFGKSPVGRVLERWDQLRESTGMRRAAHSRQVHGAELSAHESGDEKGLLIASGYDGHLTRAPGLLLTVSVADCVPVYLVDPPNRVVAIVHAGWRGVAAGIVERAIDRMKAWQSSEEDEAWLHAGPSICGGCYEVGPEVHERVWPGMAVPAQPAPIDLRTAIVTRALRKGLAAERISVSSHCTLCGPGSFFSHRGGSPERQMAVVGIRD
jgi:hypothetical protein